MFLSCLCIIYNYLILNLQWCKICSYNRDLIDNVKFRFVLNNVKYFNYYQSDYISIVVQRFNSATDFVELNDNDDMSDIL